LTTLSLVLCVGLAEARVVGEPIVLGPRGLDVQMDRNPEVAAFIARRGYPDWAELVEVDDGPPLAAHEVHLYYLRLDKEIAFTQAYLLGDPEIGVRRYERPLPAAKRAWIEHVYLAHDPARRAELAAARAEAAAERTEHAAVAVVAAADRSAFYADKAERAFHRRLRK
jgi:hypothetical protein